MQRDLEFTARSECLDQLEGLAHNINSVEERFVPLTIKWTADLDCGAVTKTASVGCLAIACKLAVTGRTPHQEMLYRKRIKAERK